MLLPLLFFAFFLAFGDTRKSSPETSELKSYLRNLKNFQTTEIEPGLDELHVVVAISNPCEYKRRWHLGKEFIERLKDLAHMKLYVVELVYNKHQSHPQFQVTDPQNPHHLQLHTDTHPLWHKESMINIGIRKLLPPNWRHVAWMDPDIEFENPAWVEQTIHVLKTKEADVVQLFSHSLNLDAKGSVLDIFQSGLFQFVRNMTFSKSGIHMWHSGFAWACSREAYEQMNGLFDVAIVGGADNHMMNSFLDIPNVPSFATRNFHEAVAQFKSRVKNFHLGYIPGTILHFFHGSQKNRQYLQRLNLIKNFSYDPKIHVTYNDFGLVVPTGEFPQGLAEGILEYFRQRNEDE